MTTRTDWVDYAKAIGIILVVYGHVARGLFSAGIELPISVYRLADSVVYSFHMPLFFFLSGLFFYHSFSKRGGIGLTLNKVDTIVYPYLIWSILQGSIELILSNYTNGNVTISEVFMLWDPRAQFWFLYALFFVFILSCVFFHFFSEKHAVLVLIVACIIYLSSELISDIRPILFVADNLVFFVLGIVFTKYNSARMLASKSALLITVFSFILCQYFFHGYLDRLYTDKGLMSLLLAFVSISFIVALSIQISQIPNRLLAYIGASSMAIYLMHILAGSGARVILSKVFDIDSISIHLIIGCLSGVLLPLLGLKIIDSLRFPYVFSAPISRWLEFTYNRLLKRSIR